MNIYILLLFGGIYDDYLRIFIINNISHLNSYLKYKKEFLYIKLILRKIIYRNKLLLITFLILIYIYDFISK